MVAPIVLPALIEDNETFDRTSTKEQHLKLAATLRQRIDVRIESIEKLTALLNEEKQQLRVCEERIDRWTKEEETEEEEKQQELARQQLAMSQASKQQARQSLQDETAAPPVAKDTTHSSKATVLPYAKLFSAVASNNALSTTTSKDVPNVLVSTVEVPRVV